jgi:hypothetical protein
MESLRDFVSTCMRYRRKIQWAALCVLALWVLKGIVVNIGVINVNPPESRGRQ